MLRIDEVPSKNKRRSRITVAQKAQTQINLQKHKSISQNKSQFPKTQINFPKHKSVFQNTNQSPETQINFTKHKSISKDWALHYYERDGLERRVLNSGQRSFRDHVGKTVDRSSILFFPGHLVHNNVVPSLLKLICVL